ncbi:hypothetical protein tinsulaeT_28040 [Thalassotalea insulae]|uniref:OmpA-like domain-containing protein n=1 Tax=Thalassotalea insulae TaxID=2056778 RepID=A0ABQ6GW87_9GAMM|nr:OmpA family protein [Thalassotalea insulae]GLX79464.1 hypothetical protein tinsulaeT_28040 [Thalassotalea insulae]
MKNLPLKPQKLVVLTTAIMLTMSCSVAPTQPDGADIVRQKLSALQANSALASRAQVAIKEAESATRIAEVPEKNQQLAEHRVFIADHKVEIALALAQRRLLEDQRAGLNEQSETARLDSRSREAYLARTKMLNAEKRGTELTTQLNAQTQEAKLSRKNMLSAEKRSTELKKQLNAQTQEAKLSRENMLDAEKRNSALEQQLVELNAKKTDRGMVLTLGDLLFEFGKSDLVNNMSGDLNQISLFLNKYQDRQLLIEGYTDNVGNDEYNVILSKQRAESVKSYLLGKGIADGRMTTLGKGKNSPIATNDSVMGRQINRRVEIIISDKAI